VIGSDKYNAFINLPATEWPVRELTSSGQVELFVSNFEVLHARK